jgi:hypothetical protein
VAPASASLTVTEHAVVAPATITPTVNQVMMFFIGLPFIVVP